MPAPADIQPHLDAIALATSNRDAALAGLQASVVAAQQDAAAKSGLLTDAENAVALANAAKDGIQKQLDAANAALAAQAAKPAAVVTPAISVGPTITLIPDGTDLSTLPLTDGGIYIALLGVGVTLTGTWTITAKNVRILGTGSTPLTINLRPGQGTAINAMGAANFEFAGFAITGPRNCQVIQPGPSNNIHDCTLLNTIEQFAVVAWPAGNGSTFNRIVAKVPHGSRLVYVTGADDVTVSNCVSPGSLGEAVVRVSPMTDLSGAVTHIANNTVVTGNTFGTANPAGRKSPIDFRQATNPVITKNTITDGKGMGGWLRLGEDSPTPTVLNAIVTGNTFDPDPNNIDQVSLMAATAKVDGNTFRVNATQRPISFGSGSQLLSADSNTVVSLDGKPPKQLINNAGKFSDGTNTKHQ